MRITPVAASQPIVNANEGHTATPDKLARAKAIASGQEPTQRAQVQATIPTETPQKIITMRTQRSTNLPIKAEAPPTAEESAIPAHGEPVTQAPEATTPEDPQFAALAKAKRTLQAREREIQAREDALKTSPAVSQPGGYTKEQIQANALSILREAGVTNEQLTDQILNESQSYGPGFTKLEAELKAIKESLDTQSKTAVDREAQAEKQVLDLVRQDVDAVIAQGDDFEAVRESGYAPKVVELMHKVFKTEGKLLDASEAAEMIENQIIEDSLKFARLKKVQSRINPAPVEPPAAKPSVSNVKIMRTLTNRDGVSSVMGRRERAIAAAEGRLK